MTPENAEELKDALDQVPYSLFFKVWYNLQKSLGPEEKKSVLTKVGRAIGKEIRTEGVEDEEALLKRLREFLESEWGLSGEVEVELVRDNDGNATHLRTHLQKCAMCPANTYFKKRDGGQPACMFPPVVMAALSKFRKKFGLKNLAFEEVKKPGPVGECEMLFRIR
ncbi:MAG: hypothetical protein Kow0069_33860 [Promethearchaeota archaeon]